MRTLSDIMTVSLGATALVTLVCANPTPGVRTAIELINNKTQISLTFQRTASAAGARDVIELPGELV